MNIPLEEANKLPLVKKLILKNKCGVSFYDCLVQCIGNTELITQLEKLKVCSFKFPKEDEKIKGLFYPPKNKEINKNIKKFIDFVWECVFTRF